MLIPIADSLVELVKAATLNCGSVECRRAWKSTIEIEQLGARPLVLVHPGTQTDRIADRATASASTFTLLLTMQARVQSADAADVDPLATSLVQMVDAVRKADYEAVEWDFTEARIVTPCGWSADHDNVYVGVAELTFEGDRE